ncbi:MAG: MBL fold metallo-hydrolase [Acidimicrobiales bacterium]
MTGAAEVAPGVRRLTATNPSPMTGEGTQSYLVGTGDLVVVDPGPDDAGHLDRIVDASGGRIRYVVVTHAHDDHAPGARSLARRTGALVLGPPAGGAYAPDAVLADADVVAVPGWRLTALHTPGHAAGHLCYLLDIEREDPGFVAGDHRSRREGAVVESAGPRLLFSGDHLLGGASTVVAPPEGDMVAYLASLERLLRLDPGIDAVAPGHGPLLAGARAVIVAQLAHRAERERQVVAALERSPHATPAGLATTVYGNLDPGLVPAARLQVWAHLRKLATEGRARSTDPDDPGGSWDAV